MGMIDLYFEVVTVKVTVFGSRPATSDPNV